MESFTEGMAKPMGAPAEEIEELELYPGDPSKLMKIGANLLEPFRTCLINFLRAYGDIFAKTASDNPGLHTILGKDRLSVNPEKKSVW